MDKQSDAERKGKQRKKDLEGERYRQRDRGLEM